MSIWLLGRRPVATDVINHSSKRELANLFKEAREELDSGGRVFIVFSLIQDSSSEIMKEVKSIEEEFKLMQVMRIRVPRMINALALISLTIVYCKLTGMSL